jgi:hypothetical protein
MRRRGLVAGDAVGDGAANVGVAVAAGNDDRLPFLPADAEGDEAAMAPAAATASVTCDGEPRLGDDLAATGEALAPTLNAGNGDVMGDNAAISSLRDGMVWVVLSPKCTDLRRLRS